MLCILKRKILEHHSRMHEHTHMHIALRIMQWFCNTHQTHLRVYEEFTSFLANCRHPDECFGLLALISAVQPKSPTRLPNSLPFTNTHWTIQPLDINGLPIPYLHMTHTSRAILYLHIHTYVVDRLRNGSAVGNRFKRLHLAPRCCELERELTRDGCDCALPVFSLPVRCGRFREFTTRHFVSRNAPNEALLRRKSRTAPNREQ